MTFLGIDLGQKRIGLAISESGILARGYKTLVFSNRDLVIKEIIAIVQKEEVGKIVVGLPKLKSGTESSQTEFVRNFIQELKTRTNISIAMTDEYLSSKEAERLLKEMNPKITKNRRAMREKIDQMAAKLILEQYLRTI